MTFEYAGRSGKESAKLGPPDVVSCVYENKIKCTVNSQTVYDMF